MNTTGNIRKVQREFASRLPKQLTPVPSSEWPSDLKHAPLQAWRSREYTVQLFDEPSQPFAGMFRLSICRSKLGRNGRWEDGLSWDELQQIKADVGYGDWYAVEVYPPNQNVVDVANMRHLWLLPADAQRIGWFTP